MTAIDPSHRLATLLRSEVAALQQRGKLAGARPGKAAGVQDRHGVPGAVLQRIAAIAPDDPDRKRKAVRVFLESTLLQEFGARLVHDPSFPSLVEAVQKQMDEDDRLARAAARLGELLLSA